MATPPDTSQSLRVSSRIQTRPRNKETHPGSIDAKAKRRTTEEVKAAAAEEMAVSVKASIHRRNNVAKVGRIEDKILHEDRMRAHPKNHRKEFITPFRPPAPVSTAEDITFRAPALGMVPFKPRCTESDKSNSANAYSQSEEMEEPEEEHYSENEDTNYMPPRNPDVESETDNDNEDETGASEVGVKRKSKKGKYPTPGRAEINATRSTTGSVGSPLTAIHTTRSSAPPKKKPKHLSAHLEGGLVVGWKPSTSKRLGLTASQDRSDVQDESMVNEVRGFVGDREEDEHERRALQSNNSVVRVGLHASMIKITPGHQMAKPRTKKEARGGAARWTTAHLPPNTVQDFAKVVTPLVKIRAGTLPPWSNLSVAQIQDIIDCVYGDGKYTVTNGDVWCGLIAARISNWRNAFATAAVQAIDTWINNNSSDFESPEDVAWICELYLTEKGEPPHLPFWWREWAEGEDTGLIKKKGMFQNELIMYTLAHAHFVEYVDMPDVDGLEDEDKPTGALILALQAVEHALKSRRTGVHVEQTSTSGHFSADNYGDIVEQKIVEPTTGVHGTKKGARPAMVKVANRRASRFLKSTAALTDRNWQDIFRAANFHLNSSKKRKARSRCRSSSSFNNVESDDVINETSMDFEYMSDPDSVPGDNNEEEENNEVDELVDE